jgi:hypothetical protein
MVKYNRKGERGDTRHTGNTRLLTKIIILLTEYENLTISDFTDTLGAPNKKKIQDSLNWLLSNKIIDRGARKKNNINGIYYFISPQWKELKNKKSEIEPIRSYSTEENWTYFTNNN